MLQNRPFLYFKFIQTLGKSVRLIMSSIPLNVHTLDPWIEFINV